jgi:hypothetical protein
LVERFANGLRLDLHLGTLVGVLAQGGWNDNGDSHEVFIPFEVNR